MTELTGEPLGMPAARPFTTKGASAKRPVFVTPVWFLADLFNTTDLDPYDYGLEIEDAGDEATFEDNIVVGFNQAELDRFLKETGFEIGKKTQSLKKNVIWVWPKDSTKRDKLNLPEAVRKLFVQKHGSSEFTTQIDDFGGQRPDAFAAIATNVLGPVVKKKMRLTTYGAQYSAYSAEGNFQIKIWSTPHPNARRTVRPPDYIWNNRVEHNDAAFVPPKEDETREALASIVLYDGTYAVAEVLQNAIYIHHHVVAYGSDRELFLFATILSKAAQLLANTDEWKKHLAAAQKAAEEVRHRSYKTLVDQCVMPRAHRTRGTLEAAKRTAEELRQKYFAAERDVFVIQNELPENSDAVAKRFIAELEKLRTGKVAQIEKMEFRQNGTIVLHTGTMCVRSPDTGKLHELGKFEVWLDLNSGLLSKIVNKTRTPTVDGRTCHSPHIFGTRSNDICLGNIAREVQAYLAHFEVEAVATLITAFLQSVAPGHAYVLRLGGFPVVQETPEKRKAAA